jgi:hypothetical protein
MFKKACLYARDKACYFQSWEFCLYTKNRVKGTFSKSKLGYQVDADGSGYSSVTACGYDGDDAADLVTDYTIASRSGDT